MSILFYFHLGFTMYISFFTSKTRRFGCNSSGSEKIINQNLNVDKILQYPCMCLKGHKIQIQWHFYGLLKPSQTYLFLSKKMYKPHQLWSTHQKNGNGKQKAATKIHHT
ncbi:hypothetical protein V8G54_029875 [Vigna mungo]|uniref:Uncharacterized protein n=1 Tax=Vigna mungo TaxID=3915 RepID=A0AAQ3MW10_VIGMU